MLRKWIFLLVFAAALSCTESGASCPDLPVCYCCSSVTSYAANRKAQHAATPGCPLGCSSGTMWAKFKPISSMLKVETRRQTLSSLKERWSSSNVEKKQDPTCFWDGSFQKSIRRCCRTGHVCFCVPPAASGVVRFDVFNEVDLLGLSRPRRAAGEVTGSAEEREQTHKFNKLILLRMQQKLRSTSIRSLFYQRMGGETLMFRTLQYVFLCWRSGRVAVLTSWI